jgi:hypothetical protein
LLADQVQLERASGGGLVGDGATGLIDIIEAKKAGSGRIRLPRQAYPGRPTPNRSSTSCGRTGPICAGT